MKSPIFFLLIAIFATATSVLFVQDVGAAIPSSAGNVHSTSWQIQSGKIFVITNPDCLNASGVRLAEQCNVELAIGKGTLLTVHSSPPGTPDANGSESSIIHYLELDSWPPNPATTTIVRSGLRISCREWLCTYERIKSVEFVGATEGDVDLKVTIHYQSPNVLPTQLQLLRAQFVNYK